MLNNFLYITIGLSVAIFVPHLQNIFNAIFSGNREMLMNEFSVTWQPIVVLVPLITIIALILWQLDKRKELKKEERDKQNYEVMKTDLRKTIEDIFDQKLSVLNLALNDIVAEIRGLRKDLQNKSSGNDKTTKIE